MMMNGDDIKNELSCQVCIVGGGAAGITLAHDLSKKGADIILIESGGKTYDQATQDLYKANHFDKPFPNPAFSRLRFLGGSSNHWQNNTSPLSRLDFEKRDGIENSGWPITFDEVNKYYPRAQGYCGVSDDGYDALEWSSKLKKMAVTQQSNVIESRIAKSPILPTRFYNSYGSDIEEAENVRILTYTNIVDLDFDVHGSVINRIRCQTLQNNHVDVNAEIFVLCCGGLENARLMLLFNEKYKNKLGNSGDNVGRYLMEHPTPRAAHALFENDIDLSFYQASAVDTRLITGFFSLNDATVQEHETINLRMPLIERSNYYLSDGISSMHTLQSSLDKGNLPDDTMKHLWNVISDLDMVAEGIARKRYQSKIFDHASQTGGYEIIMMMEQTPNKDNRITLSDKKDKLGTPKINIDYKVLESDKMKVWKSLGLFADEVGRLDIGRVRLLRERVERLWDSQLGFSQHHMGTTRMATNEKEGVVDSDCLVFGTNNFYIAGSSIFCTGGSVPPTLTIVALALRLSDHIKGKLK